MLHIPSTSSLLLAAKHESYNKACHSTKNLQEFSRKKSDREWTSILKKKKKRKEDRKSNKTRQKNKRRDSKVELNDSPEIPHGGGGEGGGDFRHPRPPFWGDGSNERKDKTAKAYNKVAHSPTLELQISQTTPPYLHKLLVTVKRHHNMIEQDCHTLDKIIADHLAEDTDTAYERNS